MPNTYDKLTLKTFRKKLKDGGYETATGARRGLGRIQGWNKKDKEAAARSIDRHFDGAAPAKKTKAKKKVAKKKTVAKKRAVKRMASMTVAAKKVKASSKKKTAAKAASKKTAAKAAPKKAKAKVKTKASKTATKRSAKSQTVLEMFELSEMTVGTMTQFITTLEKCRDLSGIDVDKSVQMAADIMEHDLQQLHSAVVPKKGNGKREPLTAEEKVEADKFKGAAGTALSPQTKTPPRTPPAPAATPPSPPGTQA